MSYATHLPELYGLPAFDFPARGAQRELPEAGAVAWRLAVSPYGDDPEETFDKLWERFTGAVDLGQVRALIVGQWGEPYDNDSSGVVRMLVEAKDQLPELRAVFLGDLEMEEAEISWIEQSDVTPVLDAFPLLEEFGVRGGTGLRFPAVKHEHLRGLAIEAGGLPREAVRGVAASEFPALEHLEIWLGQQEYGGDAQLADVEPLLAPGRYPVLRHLGLRNCEFQDAIAAAVAASPLVDQLGSLDLSLGVLTDEGATALLSGRPLTHLKSLNLSHNYFTEPVAERIKAALEPAGVKVALDEEGDAWEDEDGTVHRYTAVGE